MRIFAFGKKRARRYARRWEKITEIWTSQMTRLIDQYRGSGKIARRSSRRNRFGRPFTDRDGALLAATYLAHERLSGPATCRILKREWEVFGKPEYERLAGISPSHLYNLRGGEAYRKRAGVWEKTRCGPVSIRERRRPEPHNEPLYLRVDTVHQATGRNAKAIDFTGSQASRTTDNALIEGKNGAIVRKHKGYEYIACEHVERVQKF